MLFEFFRIVSNTYFLINAILQCMEFSPLTPISMGGPLVVVLFAWMARQTLEDVVRMLLPHSSSSPLLTHRSICSATFATHASPHIQCLASKSVARKRFH